jgi:hypothetical protein
MPHLSDEPASGAAFPTSLLSASRIGRSSGGCWAKNPSTGAPKSARGPIFFGAAALGRDVEVWFRARARFFFAATGAAAFFALGFRVVVFEVFFTRA